jgi:hypothetical protein
LRPHGFLSRRSPTPPLGFAPSGQSNESLDSDFAESPLTRFTGSGDYSPNPSASQSIDRLSPRLARHASKHMPAEATLVGFMHLPNPEHSGWPTPGLFASPCIGPYITAGSPMLLRHLTAPYRGCSGPVLGAEHCDLHVASVTLAHKARKRKEIPRISAGLRDLRAGCSR